MLDQNTDRMWFVIGAVIVGAAIIFIANGTMPDIFASVTNGFEASATKATTVIDDMVFEMGYDKPIDNSNADFSQGQGKWYWRGEEPDFTGNSVKYSTEVDATRISDIFYKIPVKKNEVVQIKVRAKGTGQLLARFGLNSVSQGEVVHLTDEYQTFTFNVNRYEGNQNIIFVATRGSRVEIDSIQIDRLGDIFEDYNEDASNGVRR